ncbi:hypothetical protein J1605_002962, partial [Eschrichtius robustus]
TPLHHREQTLPDEIPPPQLRFRCSSPNSREIRPERQPESRFRFTFPGFRALPPWRVGVQRLKRKMSTMFADTLLIVFISVCTALLAEGITWVLVYRTDKYKRLKAEVEKQSKKCEYGNIL